MASSSGNSSGSTQIQNSGSEGELQTVIDQRKRKRMQSNRESARRSRMRKQKHLDDLMAQVNHLRKENSQIFTTMNMTTEQFLRVDAENSVLRAQVMELSHRLDSLNEILDYMNTPSNITGVYENGLTGNTDNFLMTPWNLMCVNQIQQPIMASADMFQY